MMRWVLLALLFAQQPETMSLLNEPLYPPALGKQARAAADEAYAAARAAYQQRPNDRAAILGLARASMTLGRVGDSLEVLTRGLESNPEEPTLLLERGRAYIVFRKLEVAERDLRGAASLPEAHCALGFALYLSGQFARARDTYKGCAQPDAFASLATRRAERASAPARSIPPAAAPPPIRFPGAVSSRAEPKASLGEGYVQAIEELLGGNETAARDRLKKIVEKHRRQDWMEPVYIAAEADYARLYKPPARRKPKLAANNW